MSGETLSKRVEASARTGEEGIERVITPDTQKERKRVIRGCAGKMTTGERVPVWCC